MARYRIVSIQRNNLTPKNRSIRSYGEINMHFMVVLFRYVLRFVSLRDVGPVFEMGGAP